MTSVLEAYHALIAAGELRADPDQQAAAVRLDQLQHDLEAVPRRGSTLWRMLGKEPDSPRGLYLWGDGRARQVDADGLVLQLPDDRPQAPRPISPNS